MEDKNKYINEYRLKNKEKIKTYNKEYSKKYREDKREELIKSKKEYYENNKEKILKDQKEYVSNNQQKTKETLKKWYQKNKVTQKDKIKKYHDANEKSIKEYKKQWYQDNKKRIAAAKKERMKIDPLFKLKSSISSRIRTGIKSKGFCKKFKTKIILGCTYEDFKLHLEVKFEPWMNWSNYGNWNNKDKNSSWDLDHIIPISSAKTEEEVIKLNHFTNFQPLCSFVNRFIKKEKIQE